MGEGAQALWLSSTPSFPAATFVSSTGLQAELSSKWLRDPISEANLDVMIMMPTSKL